MPKYGKSSPGERAFVFKMAAFGLDIYIEVHGAVRAEYCANIPTNIYHVYRAKG